MPVGTILTDAQRYTLDSAPKNPDVPGDEDGFILARPLPYGMKLERRDKSTRMRIQQMQQTKRSIRQNEPQEQIIEIESESTWAANFDFAYCIVDHNLTDQNGTKLDFANPMAIKTLNPKIGTEIEEILSKINGDDVNEESMEDFIKPLTESSQEKVTNSTLSPVT